MKLVSMMRKKNTYLLRIHRAVSNILAVYWAKVQDKKYNEKILNAYP